MMKKSKTRKSYVLVTRQKTLKLMRKSRERLKAKELSSIRKLEKPRKSIFMTDQRGKRRIKKMLKPGYQAI